MTIYRATCSCGKVVATAAGDPVRISICHCLDCQRRTGSAFGAQARFPTDAVTIDGESREFTRVADSGNRITFHFCAVCGSTVYYLPEAEQDLVALPLGAFADPDFPPPQVSVYEARRHGWVGLPDDIQHFD